MKEKIIIVLALLMLIISGVLLVGYFKKVPTNMAKLGYYLCVEEDEEKIMEDLVGLHGINHILICYRNRAAFTNIGANIAVESDMEKPVFWDNLTYDKSKITFTDNSTKRVWFHGELNGDVITLKNENGDTVRYRWMGLPGPKDQPFDYNKDEKAATVEIRANQEKRKKAVFAVCAVDFMICVLAFGGVVLCRRKRKRERDMADQELQSS